MNIWYENIINNSILSDIHLHKSGIREKSINHSFPPYNMDYYLINYISEGEAEFSFCGKKETFKKHQLYVMFPNSGMSYITKRDTPWSIYWIIVSGEKISKLLFDLNITPQNPVIDIENHQVIETLFKDIFTFSNSTKIENSLKCIELTYKLFRKLLEKQQPKQYSEHINRAMNYIKMHIGEKITTRDIASYVNLNNNYFGKLFKSEVGITPTEAINQIKIEQAQQMLTDTHLPIGYIAESLGFADHLYFSKLFNSYVGLSPKMYRRLTDI